MCRVFVFVPFVQEFHDTWLGCQQELEKEKKNNLICKKREKMEERKEKEE
jgi:hypothetical protein